MESSNYRKYTSKSLVKKILIELYFRKLTSLLKGRLKETLIEVGCGEGFVLSRLKNKWPKVNMEGVDISRDSIVRGQEMFPQLFLEVRDLMAVKGHYDTVLCLEVLEHLQNPGAALKKIVEVASEYVILSVPDEPWFERLSPSKEHINHWNETTWLQFLSKHKGLQLIECRRSFPWLLTVLKKYD